ncbi:di-trans,poly-cis-decaprenylcistransferase [Candidatus Peribacteria bacterium RIFCSPLOWO2_12_FULL_55_15]|nr:MAG: di-trans,poly-cis-decaprenylcistransferase [Candidatus Peribacteria bacterium RIFCSPHIGHO2_01_FULL_54_22]OGJ62440.1 MAG: di-trans,poly-cis-decaprenylcistransferase [Candidatus Peribacteria bacterium RIFCSPHIGHO2_02_FULL_55_24]OGJ64014.1 MAG: di-trans,poly-cis-decaprenylcistransferase [Candidatus Peribacteria bacterium RIFCSPHIGHO2_12_FULL_54_10]OGJ68773.1 MAG: di-trans,poly-cis-decaprenylcistransferase [Candidatus Peribacteria bacterium RIFCSPLOWO2_01_FULL_54_110]OGJ69978.1 MAG: di-tran
MPETPQKLHLALIPDGNRRWARAKGLHPWNGHAKAVENFRSLSDWCRENPRISLLTIWCFSTENWKRDSKEIRKLMDLLESYIRKNRADMAKQGTRFLHSGRTDRIPPSLAKALKEIAEETKGNTNFTLHLALDYGGKDEIIRAWKKSFEMHRLCHGKKNFTQDDTIDPLRPYLDHPSLPDIDLIIRTSGESRTSNFFLWQSTYAEWFFLEKHFPELTTKDLEEVLQKFDERQRRFGS